MLPIEHQFSHGSPTPHPSSTPLVSPRFPRSHMVQLVNQPRRRQIGRVANVVEGAFAASSAIGAVAKPMTTSSSTSMTPEHLSLEVWTPGAHTLEFWTGSWWWKPGSVHLRQAIVSVLGCQHRQFNTKIALPAHSQAPEDISLQGRFNRRCSYRQRMGRSLCFALHGMKSSLCAAQHDLNLSCQCWWQNGQRST